MSNRGYSNRGNMPYRDAPSGGRGGSRGTGERGRGAPRGDYGGERGRGGSNRGGGGGRGGRDGGRGGRGGGPPAPGQERGIHKEGQAQPPPAQLTALENKLVSTPAAARTESTFEATEYLSTRISDRLPGGIEDLLNRPVRPSYYKGGEPVTLWTNHFIIDHKPDVTLYRYSVSVQELGRKKKVDDKKAQSDKKGDAADDDGNAGQQPGGVFDTTEGKKKRRILEIYLEESPISNLRDRLATDFANMIVTREELNSTQVAAYQLEYRGDFEETALENAPKYMVVLNFIQPPLPMSILGTYLNTANNRRGSAAYMAYKQALEIIFGHRAKAQPDYVTSSIGRKHHGIEPNIDRYYLGEAIEAVRGYIASVRFSAGRLLLNVQIKHSACYTRDVESPGPLHIGQTMMACGYLPYPTTPDWQWISNFYRGVVVKVKHLPERKYRNKMVPRFRRILGLAFIADQKLSTKKIQIKADGAAPTQVFFQKDGKDWTSVYDFFKKDHSLTTSEDYPVLKVGTPQNPSFLPCEVCEIVQGQARPAGLLTGTLTSGMQQFASRRPHANAASILGRSPGVLEMNQSSSLQGFGLSPSTKDLMTVEGRVMNPPMLIFSSKDGKRAEKIPPSNGAWNFARAKFVKSGRFRPTGSQVQWGAVILKGHGNPSLEEAQRLMVWFSDTCAKQGMNMGNSTKVYECPNQGNLEANLDGIFAKASRDGLQLLLVFLPSKAPEPYKTIKHVGDTGAHGLHTVCAVWKTISKAQVGVGANIALKINLKLNGENNHMEEGDLGIVAKGETMLVGIDVTHPNPGASDLAPSIAALVASINGQCQQFPANIHIQQQGRTEMFDEAPLTELFVQALTRWWKANKFQAPKNVIVYRDGVGEGQYSTVQQKELKTLQNGFQQFKKEKKIPNHRFRISLIVCGKRHNTRFYPSRGDRADENSNPLPGTVVDRYVTDSRDWDFYLQAHAALKGTAKPCHYVVLHDEVFESTMVGDRSGALIRLTHNLSYMYGRASKAVSVCPPAYYADRACDRARMYLRGYYDNRNATPPNLQGQTLQQYFQARTRLHQNLADTMFYI